MQMTLQAHKQRLWNERILCNASEICEENGSERYLQKTTQRIDVVGVNALRMKSEGAGGCNETLFAFAQGRGSPRREQHVHGEERDVKSKLELGGAKTLDQNNSQ